MNFSTSVFSKDKLILIPSTLGHTNFNYIKAAFCLLCPILLTASTIITALI